MKSSTLAHLPKKQLTQFLLLLGLVALVVLASGLSDLNLKPGRAFVIAETEDTITGEEEVLTIPPEVVVAIITGSVFFVGLIVIIIRLLQGKEAIKEELLALFFFSIFVLGFTWILSEAVSQVNPNQIPQEQESAPPLDFSDLAQSAEEVGGAVAPEPSEGFVIVVAGVIGLGLAGLIYFVYRRFLNKPAAATLAQLALDAEATLLKLQVEDANLRDVVMRSYYDMSKTLSEQGVHRAEGMTPREFEERLITAGLPRRDVERLTRLFEEVRYGHVSAGERQKREAIACMQAIVAAAQQRAAVVNRQSSPLPSNRPI